jgi:hypothetical protein
MTEVAGLDHVPPTTADDRWTDFRHSIAARLRECGAVTMTVDDLTVQRFGILRDRLIERPGEYREAATPRSAYADGVWSATDLPASQRIDPHNESSYRLSWPGRILFGCVHPPDTGGQTLLTDVRAVCTALPADVVGEFRDRGWMLVRNYQPDIGVPWQDAFGTTEHSDVLEYCRANDIETEWRDGDVLRTRQVRPAVTRHPVTHDELWFNHIAFWHVSSLPARARTQLEDEFGPDGVPFATYYGDGGVIPDDVMSVIRQCYQQATVEYRWRAGALLLLDNMRVAHGRLAFTGTRTIVVAMGDDVSRDMVGQP